MKVVWTTEFGPPEVLVAGELPDPVARRGHVVVDVHAAALTFVDTQIRAGTDKWHSAPAVPHIPGGVISGHVSSLGADVDPDWLGRAVLADTNDEGALAEKSLLPVSSLIKIPERVGLHEAAAIYSDGTTAFGLVKGAEIQPNEWVLVEAAAGGVGTLLVQLAMSAGARVIGAARGEKKLDFLRELGADEVIDYSAPDWAEKVRALTGGDGPAVIFDGIGGALGRTAFELTAPGGRFSIHGASSGSLTKINDEEALARGVTVLPIEQLFDFPTHQAEWLNLVFAEVADGRIRPVIGQTFTLADGHKA
ncbi:MAG: zinc-binding dehydrogenase, partial [Paracoccaceae bacterium]